MCVCVWANHFNCFALLYEEQFHVPQFYNFSWFVWYLKGKKNTGVLTFCMLNTSRNHKHFINNSGWTDESLRKIVSEWVSAVKEGMALKSIWRACLMGCYSLSPSVKVMSLQNVWNRNVPCNELEQWSTFFFPNNIFFPPKTFFKI